MVFSQEELEKLQAIRKARSEQKRRTVRAGILLDAASGKMSDQAIAQAHGVNRNTVVLCVNKCLRFGWKAALGELPRAGRPRRLSGRRYDLGVALCQPEAQGTGLLL